VETRLEKDNVKINITVLVYFGIVVTIYGVSSFFPDSFLWGVNHLAFFQPMERLIFFLFIIITGLPFISKRYLKVIVEQSQFHVLAKKKFYAIVFILGVIIAYTCYQFRITTDMYGDTRMLVGYLSWKKYTLLDVLNLDNREPLTQMFHQLIASILHIDIKSAFEIVSSVCGGFFIAVVLIFVRGLDGSKLWKLFIFILLITSGTNQLFFGHVEDYTIIYLTIVLFLMLGWMLFTGKKTLTLMLITFVIGSRIHLEMLLLLPALIFATIYTLQFNRPAIKHWLLPARIFLVVSISLVCVAFAYFFYFEAYRYNGTDAHEVLRKIFLPIYNHLPSPHSYTLLSLSHFSDFIQELLLTVSPVAFLILIMGVIFIKRINWREPQTIFFELASFYFLVLNFTVNPALSMPRDWDFLSQAAIPILFLAVTLSQKLFKDVLGNSHQRKIVGVGLALGIFSFSFFYINSNQELASRRLEGIGKWAFKSYYSASTYMLNVSAKMVGNLDEQIQRREEVINDLLPYASKPDLEIGFLYHKLGVAQYTNQKFEQAAFSFQKSLEQDPQNASAIKLLALIALEKWNFDEAERIFRYYNKNINHPNIIDSQGIELEKYCIQLKNLVSSKVDSSIIQNKLEYIFKITK
jgi:tetratricopeptide (TPR) repeat protein